VALDAADETPADVDPPETVGTLMVGMLGLAVDVFGIDTLGTLIDGAEI
jgi:hypothetical protein